MKKLIITTGSMASMLVPLSVVVSCDNRNNNQQEERILKSQYIVNSPIDLLNIFKDANYNIGESEARNFYQSFSSLKPQPLQAIVYKGQKQTENYDEKNVYIVIKGLGQITNTTLTDVDPEVISYGDKNQRAFNVSAAYNDKLSLSEQENQAPILFDSFGITENDLSDASFAFLLSSVNGKNATVSMQQFQRAAVDPKAIIYKILGAFKTNIIGQIPTDESNEQKFAPVEYGQLDYQELFNNKQQWMVAKNGKLPSEQTFENKFKAALKAANVHINNMFEMGGGTYGAGISQEERKANKGITRYLQINDDLSVHWIENGIDYKIQTKDTKDSYNTSSTGLPQLLNFVLATKVDDKSVVHDEEYFKKNVQGPKWLSKDPSGNLEVNNHYLDVYNYLLGFTGFQNEKELVDKCIKGLSEADPNWVK